MSEIEQIAKSVSELVKPGMRPKQLIEAVRKEHPKATKKEITRAAFYAVIVAAAEQKPGHVQDLHNLAMDTRNNLQEDAEISKER